MRTQVCMLQAAGLFALGGLQATADTFGGGGNQFVIEFVNVGNAGNGDDLGAGGGIYSSPYGGVTYNYRISTYEISQGMLDRATALGMDGVVSGAWSGSQPAANLAWGEAARFVNWLNTSHGYHEAYNLSFSFNWHPNLWGVSEQAHTGLDSGTNPYRHKDAFYFLPSEDEWFKAAYHQNDGVTDNYWDYPTGDNAVPDGIDFVGDPNYGTVFYDDYYEMSPHTVTDVGSGASSYGTYGQGGNVWEWTESAYDGVNDSAAEDRVTRGGAYQDTAYPQRSSSRGGVGIWAGGVSSTGFRVASLEVIPEPTSLTLLGLGSLALLMARREEGDVCAGI